MPNDEKPVQLPVPGVFVPRKQALGNVQFL